MRPRALPRVHGVGAARGAALPPPAYYADPAAAPVCVALDKAVRAAFPEESSARDLEEEAQSSAARRARSAAAGVPEDCSMPLFVCDPIVPGQTARLHVFEPRYRALMKLVLANDRTFGMIGPPRGGESGDDEARMPCARHGCVCEITEVSALPDGRFVIACVARSRFRVVTTALAPAGFYVASVASPHDGEDAVGEGDDEQDDAKYCAALAEESERAVSLLEEWLGEVGRGNVGYLKQHYGGSTRALLDAAGPRPPPPVRGRVDRREAHERAEKLSWHLCQVLNPLPVLGAAEEIRPECMASDGPLARLRVISACLEECIPAVRQVAERKIAWQRMLANMMGRATRLQRMLGSLFGR
eukprot:PRCOL_00003458-RA